MDKQFVITKNIKTVLTVGVLTGVLLIVLGLIFGSWTEERIWANVLLNGFLVISLSLGAVFFVAVHLIAESGWQTTVQRIAEAIGSNIWLGALMIVPIVFGVHSLYHWSHTEHLDSVLQLKQGYLNLPFFILRMIIYIAGWTFLIYKIRQLSLKSDSSSDLKVFYKLRTYSALFVVFIAITSSTSAWDWLMSIDAHWFSTLYGWYTFIGLFVNTIAVIIILVIVLQKLGYLNYINDEHLHDLGKYLFGFSIFWAYLWISQYLLIWYSNIPEETVYYVERITNFRILFYVNVVICFVVPFFALMSRGNKRKVSWLLYTSIIVFCGHWLDLFLAIMPGTVGDAGAGISVLEIGFTILYISLFCFAIFKSLTKGSLVPQNHPYYKESFDYENIK